MPWIYLIVVLLAAAPNANAQGTETVDRIVVSAGNLGITESDVVQEVRFSLFLDGRPQPSAPTAAQRSAARRRLVEQALLAEEAEEEAAEDSPLHEEANRLLNEVRSLYDSEAEYQAALASVGFTNGQALERLARNVRIVRLINRRLRPNALVNRRDIETYYQETFVPEHEKEEGTPAPPLADVDSIIREILIQREVDRLLDEWIHEIQQTRRVRVHVSQ